MAFRTVAIGTGKTFPVIRGHLFVMNVAQILRSGDKKASGLAGRVSNKLAGLITSMGLVMPLSHIFCQISSILFFVAPVIIGKLLLSGSLIKRDASEFALEQKVSCCDELMAELLPRLGVIEEGSNLALIAS